MKRLILQRFHSKHLDFLIGDQVSIKLDHVVQMVVFRHMLSSF